jgi:hypothetical protein
MPRWHYRPSAAAYRYLVSKHVGYPPDEGDELAQRVERQVEATMCCARPHCCRRGKVPTAWAVIWSQRAQSAPP